MDISRYADLFLTESREHLSAINHLLLELERAPGAAEPVGGIFRAVHTVKGMSATMGYTAVAELTHELETLLDRVRKGAQLVTPEILDVLFAAADALEAAVELSVQGRAQEVDVAALVEHLRTLGGAPDDDLPSATAEYAAAVAQAHAAAPGARGTFPDAPAPASGPAAPAASRWLVRVRLAAATALRGARALLIVRKAETLGTVSSVIPPVDALQAEEFDREFALRLDTAASRAAIDEALRGMGDVEQLEVTSEAAPAPAAPTPADGTRSRVHRHVRIDLERLDALMNMIGELVIARGRLLQLCAGTEDAVLDDTLAQASRLITELQDEIMLCRMVPVSHVFDRFPRLVRDAARGLGKQIEFSVIGKDIELDRSMLDEIGDPIVHLLRNAIDHGIEMPDTRTACGKPPLGRLTLSASRERSSVVIRVADDGQGIAADRVLEKARDLGLVDAGRGELTDEELVRLIARPGFSTADQVSDLSGRGVGIDAVHNRVRSMGGTVEIRSTPGAGTTVTVRLPLTLAIVRALLARVDDETYAVPMTHINETVDLQSSSVRSVKGRDVLVLRDEVLPLIPFRTLVQLAPRPDLRQHVIVLEIGDRRAGLVVDDLAGQQDIVVKQFDGVRESTALFSGATILSDGAPALIVDVGSLL